MDSDKARPSQNCKKNSVIFAISCLYWCLNCRGKLMSAKTSGYKMSQTFVLTCVYLMVGKYCLCLVKAVFARSTKDGFVHQLSCYSIILITTNLPIVLTFTHDSKQEKIFIKY